MSMHRTHRMHMEREDARQTMARNHIFKSKERKRREARMLATIRTGTPPYAPQVLSWLSGELGKPARKITPEDVKTLLS